MNEIRNGSSTGVLAPVGRGWRALGVIAALALAIAPAAPGRAAEARDRSGAGSVTAAAVAPFVGERVEAPLSGALAEALATRGLERVLGPDDFVSARALEPRASDVRRWAYNAAVDVVLVGRVSHPKAGSGDRLVEVVVHSGHSGAALTRHDARIAARALPDGAIDGLAAAILESVGRAALAKAPSPEASDAPGAAAPSKGRPDATKRADAAPSADDAAPGGLFESELSRSGFTNDAPIEIKADEAEIIDRRNGRKLIFQRNVRVRQANVTLRSERLEASYRKGESDPRELVAEGDVEIVQDDRRAHCDRAVYQRDANRLTCRGHAELVQGCDIVRGESIEFDLAGDQARVEGAASIVIQPEDATPSGCPDARGRS